MKILLITDNHSPNGGGAERCFFTLKSELQKQAGITVHSLGFGPQPQQNDDTTIINESPFRLSRLWSRLFFNPIKYWQIRRAVQKFRPDVIHIHNVRKYGISLFKAIAGYPVIQTVHDYHPICPTGWNIHRDLSPCPTGLTHRCLWQHNRQSSIFIYLGKLCAFYRMRKLLKNTVRIFIAPSPLLVQYLNTNGYQPSLCITPFRANTATKDFGSMKPNHFLYVGQLGKHKGIHYLIKEFALACKQNKNLILYIAGKGSQEKALKQRVNKLGLDNNIFFLGWVNPEVLYQTCIAVIFPSIGLESFGLTLTEAMSHARPIIGVNRGSTPWLVHHNQTGLLFDPLKTGDLAEKILLLAENTALAQQYGKEGYLKLARMMNNEEIINKTIALYKSFFLDTKKGA